jgi:hypothetical protein
VGPGRGGKALAMGKQQDHPLRTQRHLPTANERSPVPERPIIVFDVNETLLDLDSIDPTGRHQEGDQVTGTRNGIRIDCARVRLPTAARQRGRTSVFVTTRQATGAIG